MNGTQNNQEQEVKMPPSLIHNTSNSDLGSNSSPEVIKNALMNWIK